MRNGHRCRTFPFRPVLWCLRIQSLAQAGRKRIVLHLRPDQEDARSAVLVLLASFLTEPPRIPFTRHQARYIERITVFACKSLMGQLDLPSSSKFSLWVNGLTYRGKPGTRQERPRLEEILLMQVGVDTARSVRSELRQLFHKPLFFNASQVEGIHIPSWVDEYRTRGVTSTSLPG
jgi:hypothetical protein